MIIDIQPDYIFHLAAQPIVKYSYFHPLETWQTNVLGTVNILESLRFLNKNVLGLSLLATNVTKIKSGNGVIERLDKLGGGDPYSASKGSAELAFSSYHKSFFSNNYISKVRIASARAGNVIGGGDWAENRIVPDCIKSWIDNLPAQIQSKFN